MCGINLIIDKKGLLESENIIRMNKAIEYRGPDHSNHLKVVQEHSHLFFGHNRLKIIDLTDIANQPFVSQDGQYILNFNGEIYNFYELKNELISKGYSFRTHSDTEVLMKLLIEYGKGALQRLEGMFAFVFYDKRKNNFIIARDRFGMKPLYYYKDQYFFVASSEIKGLLSSSLFEKKLNKRAVHHYLKYKYAPSPETFYENVLELKAGTILEINEDLDTQVHSFNEAQKRHNYIIDKNIKGLNQEKIINDIENLLIDSLYKHTIAQVPVGLFLSGGVDSTLLLALAAKEGLRKMNSYSIVNGKEDAAHGTNDYVYAGLAAKQYGSIHHEITITTESFANFDEFINSIDQPIGDGAAFLTYLLSKEAKKEVTVILNGAGADELFAGYNRHKAFYKYLQNYDSIVKNKKALQRIGRVLPYDLNLPFRKTLRAYHQFTGSIEDDPQQTFRNFCAFSNSNKGEGHPYENQYVNKDDFIEGYFSWALQNDLENYLVYDVLALSDRMSMLSGIEMRMPYLDLNIQNYLKDTPSFYKIDYGRKWILKEILKRNDGKNYTIRKKEGFGMPFGKWVKNKQLIFLLEPLKLNDNPLYQFVKKEEIDFMLNQHMKGKRDHGQFLWALIILDNWLRNNF